MATRQRRGGRLRRPFARVGPAVLVLLVAACVDRDDGPIRGKLEVGLTTTTGTTACDRVVVAERALTEATFGAVRSTPAEREVVRGRLDELREHLPPGLADAVDELARGFEAAWAVGDGGGVSEGTISGGERFEDPFDVDAYIAADQEIRRWAAACSGPQSTGDPSRRPTTSALPPEAMTIPLPPGDPPEPSE